MVLDEVLPRAGAVCLDVSLVVDADPETTYAAVRDLDLMTVRTPLMTASTWVRGLPARLKGQASPNPPHVRLTGEGAGLPGWELLGDRDHELCFGAVGRFWTPEIEWRPVPVESFAGFAEPGWGKIAASLSVRGYGDRRALLTYECRTATYDAGTRRAFLRYWWLVRPFVAHILRATVRTVAANAESAKAATTA